MRHCFTARTTDIVNENRSISNIFRSVDCSEVWLNTSSSIVNGSNAGVTFGQNVLILLRATSSTKVAAAVVRRHSSVSGGRLSSTVRSAAMPISSGANRWPKSYWTKPQPPPLPPPPPDVPLRLIKVNERASVRRHQERTLSLPSSVDSPSKTSPETPSDGTAPDAQLETQPLRSPGAVYPLSVERLMSESRDTSSNLRSRPLPKRPTYPARQPRRSESDTAMTEETSPSTRLVVDSSKRTRTVSPALLIVSE